MKALLKQAALLAVVLLSVTSARRPPPGVRVERLAIVSELQSRFAVTDVTAEMTNNGIAGSQEVTFAMDIPDRAYISQFNMIINGRQVDGEIRKRDVARAQYEQARRDNENAGLVEQLDNRDTSTFEVSTNLAVRSKVVFNVTYQEVLRRVHGVYKHIINVRPEYDIESLTIDVLIAERERISKIHTPKFSKNAGKMTNKQLLALPEDPAIQHHSMSENSGSLAYIYYDGSSWGHFPDGQMVVLYDVERSQSGGQIETLDGYFVHFIAPDGLERGDRDVIFTIDISGSMRGRKIEQVKSALRRVITDMRSSDRFDIVTFAAIVHTWQGRLVPATEANKRAAIDFVNGMNADGGTNMNDAIVQSLQEIRSTRSFQKVQPLASMVILLTDGLPTVGEKDKEQILRNARSTNPQSENIVHTIAFGRDADYDLLKRTASQNGGVARRIYTDSDADIQLEGFYDELSSPVLRNVNIEYLNGMTVPSSLVIDDNGQVLDDDSEIIVVGQTRAQPWQNLQADVSATGAEGPVRLQASSFTHGRPTAPCFIRPRTVRLPFRTRFSGGVDPFANMPQTRHITFCPDDMHDMTGRGKRQAPSNTIAGYIERMWAYLTIRRLIDLSTSTQLNSNERAIKEERALNMSLQYHLVTPLTSLVVIDRGVDARTNLERFSDPVTPRQRHPQSDTELSIHQNITATVSPNLPQVKCDDMNVVLMIDDAIDPTASRMENGRRRAIGKLLARDVINRLRRANNKVRFSIVLFEADRDKLHIMRDFDGSQDVDELIDLIDAAFDSRATTPVVGYLQLYRNLNAVRDQQNRLLLFTDGSKSLDRMVTRLPFLARRFAMLNGVVATHDEQFTSAQLDEIKQVASKDKYIYERNLSASEFDAQLSC